jgi:hypothetical protein
MKKERHNKIEQYRSQLPTHINGEVLERFERQRQTELQTEIELALVEAIEALENQISHSVSAMIRSNEKLAASNERHERAMVRLTYALVFVGVMQAIAIFIHAFPVLREIFRTNLSLDV